MSKKLLVYYIIIALLLLSASTIWAETPLENYTSDYTTSFNKGGGITVAPLGTRKRFAMYGGHNLARLDDSLLYLVYASTDPARGVYFITSDDTLGSSWGTPMVIADINTYYQTSYCHLAVHPNNHDIMYIVYMAQPVEGNYHTYVIESTDRGTNWSETREVRPEVADSIGNVAWSTITVSEDGWLHLTFAYPGNTELHYTKSNDGGLTWYCADGTTEGSEGISFLASNVVFQGAIEIDRNGNPHIIFSGDGGPDSFGDKTPYHTWYDGTQWRPNPPTQLQFVLESIWGIPEMVFDSNNRGYYFFSQNDPSNVVIVGTWESPELSGNPDGTYNGGAGPDSAIVFIDDNYPGIGITADDDLWLPQPYVIDSGDNAGVYFAAATGSWAGDEDIVIYKTPILAETDTLSPADLDWSLVRWLTNDGAAGADNCLDMPEIGSDKCLDIVWASAGASGWEIQYMYIGDYPHGPDATVRAIDFGINPPSKTILSKGEELNVIATIRNNGTGANAPHNVYLTITRNDSNGDVIVDTQTKTTIPMSAGEEADIIFDTYIIDDEWVSYNVEVEADLPGDEYNNITSISFWSWPAEEDVIYQDTFQDTLGDGSIDITGWVILDSLAPNPDILASWYITEEFADDDYCWKVRYNTAYSIPDNEYVDDEQDMSELLYTPAIYIGNLTKADSLFLMFRHDLMLSGDANVPIWAYIDVQVGNSYGEGIWETIEHWERQDVSDAEINTFGFVCYNLDDIIDYSTSDSMWVRFWFGYPNNNGKYSEWAIDNVTIMYGDPLYTGIETEISLGNLPEAYKLEQNYPNPFNPNTTIRFETPITTNVSLNIYNIKGQLVRSLFNETLNAGRHTIHWDGKDNNEKELSSGIYLYRLEAEDYNITNSMLLLK